MKFPVMLKILRGRKWRGKLRVDGPCDGGYLVAFDAENPKSTYERFVFDRCVLSATKIAEWTGVDVEPGGKP